MSAPLWVLLLHLIKPTITHRPHLWDERECYLSGIYVSGLWKVKLSHYRAGGASHLFLNPRSGLNIRWCVIRSFIGGYSTVIDVPVCLHVFGTLISIFSFTLKGNFQHFQHSFKVGRLSFGLRSCQNYSAAFINLMRSN